jgi:hypothetical protein
MCGAMNVFRISLLGLGSMLCSLACTPAAPPRPQTQPASSSAAPAANPTGFSLGEPREAGKVKDSRLREISGLGASRLYPGCAWAHNDSGDSARLFLMGPEGQERGIVELEGAPSADWEDMAVAGEGQDAWVYVADSGNNFFARDEIVLLRFREPEKMAAGATLPARFEKMTLRYPDGAFDSEALLVSPKGQICLLSKTTGETEFFSAGAFENGATRVLKRIGSRAFVSPDPGKARGRSTRDRLVTGGDVSADGRYAAIVTYNTLSLWRIDGDWSKMLSTTPQVVLLPPMPQCESVAFSRDSKSLLAVSEGENPPLWSFELSEGK